nr:MDR family MFS transporter [Cryobacterium sp. TMS1-13-1]
MISVNHLRSRMARASRTAREPAPDGSRAHRQVLEALSGLLLGMFVSILANTVVSTSLPLILSDLKGSQSAYTWVVTATLLATTVSTPIWGKVADLFNRKLLIQLALAVFVIGSALAGFSQDSGTLIAFRVLQGLGAGGLVALSQIIMADIISPRERGRYAGLFGAVMALGTIGGPLLGGVVTDAFGWRWNFFIALPVAIVAIVLLQRTLHLPARPKRVVRMDYLGAALITSGISLLLIWVTLAGSQFKWLSLTSWVMVIGAVLLLVAAVIVEMRATEPIIPLSLFRNHTFTFATVASLAVGVSLFGTSVFLSQYMQLARGATPTESGLLTIPMMGGLLISSTLFGTVISRRGTWKSIMVSGSVLMLVGTTLLGTLDVHTSLVFVGVYMFTLGAGLGMVMQNLVLVVQNTIEVRHLGVATSSVTFFRSLGGAVGVSVMGSILGSVVATQISSRVGNLSPANQADAGRLLGDGVIPQVNLLPDVLRIIVETAYGSGVGLIFLVSAPLVLVTLLMVSLLPNHPLGTETGIDRVRSATVESTPAPESTRLRETETVEDIVIDVSAASAGLLPVGRAHDTQSIRIVRPASDKTRTTRDE